MCQQKLLAMNNNNLSSNGVQDDINDIEIIEISSDDNGSTNSEDVAADKAYLTYKSIYIYDMENRNFEENSDLMSDTSSDNDSITNNYAPFDYAIETSFIAFCIIKAYMNYWDRCAVKQYVRDCKRLINNIHLLLSIDN